MFNPAQISTDFSLAAHQYDQHARLQQEICEQAFELAQECWLPASRILDIGCGTGQLARLAKEAECGWEILGIDLAPGMCAQAAPHLPVSCGTAENLPFQSDIMDGIFSSLMLQWVDKPVDIFLEMFRVLKPGGIALLTSFVNGTLCELRDSFATLDDAVHITPFATTGTLTTAAVHTGFTMLSAEEEEFTEFYAQMKDIMLVLKAIGASNKHDKRRKSLMTPRQFKMLEEHYRKTYQQKLGLPASWQVVTLILEKPHD